VTLSKTTSFLLLKGVWKTKDVLTFDLFDINFDHLYYSKYFKNMKKNQSNIMWFIA
jgi:hypothetical protein